MVTALLYLALKFVVAVILAVGVSVWAMESGAN